MALGKQYAIVTCICLALFWQPHAMRLQAQSAVEKKSKWCWFSGSSDLKKYYFEFAFDPLVPEEHTAIELVRDPERPKLNVHHVSKWVVRTPPKDNTTDNNADLNWIGDVEAPTEMQWLPACMRDHGKCDEPGDKQEIDLLNASYIRKVLIPVIDPNTNEAKEGEEEIGIEIAFDDGRTEEFEGGVYLPRKLMLPAMQRAEDENFKFNGLAKDAKDEASAADTMFWRSLYAFRNTVTGTIATTSGTGATAGVSVGVGVGAVCLLASIPGTWGAVLAIMVAGSGAGLVAGSAAGLVLGGVIGTISGGTMALWDYHSQKKELGLAATEKIWNKLECHSKFTHCNATFIVPQGKACPGAAEA